MIRSRFSLSQRGALTRGEPNRAVLHGHVPSNALSGVLKRPEALARTGGRAKAAWEAQ
jgi:hypothetical protein